MKTSTGNRRSINISKLSLKRNNQIAIISAVSILVVGFLLWTFSNSSESVALVKNGKPKLTLLVDGTLLPLDQTQVIIRYSERGEKKLDASSEQRHAILELIKYVKQMSGAELKVKAAKDGDIGCYVGLGSSFPWLNQDVNDLGDEGFIISNEGENIYLLAQKPIGVRHAVTTFLMDQGCRWFFSGKVWEEVPQKSTIKITSTTKQVPSFPMGRTIWYGYGTYPQPANDLAEWNYHNRMGSTVPVSIGHTWYGLDVVSDFAAHPEWFALVKGQRKPNKVCYSNPEIIQLMIEYALYQAANGATSISLTPADGLSFCECDLCTSTAGGGEIREEKGSFFATRPDGVLVCTVSETLFNAVNQVARAVSEKYPGVIIGCYGYSAYSHPPSFKLEPNIFIQTTTHYRRTPLTLEEQMDMWGERASQVGIYGYWSVYQWDWDNPGVGKFVPNTIQKELQLYKNHNGTAFDTESSNNWGPRGLSYYMGSQLLWNVNADIKNLLIDFYEKAFGPAAHSMENYYMCWYGPSVGVLSSESEKGSDGYEMQISMDEFGDYHPKNTAASKTSLAHAFKYLDEAAKLVSGQPKYQQRVDQIRMYAYYLLLREKVREATATMNNNAIVEAIKNETEFGARLTNTNMIHTKPLLGKAFMRFFIDYEPLLKDIPESQMADEGWRKVGEPPTHDELEKLWDEGKKYLGLPASTSTASFSKSNSTPYPFKFKDVGTEMGIFPDIADIQGHGAGWGDIDGDGWIDIYVGTFNDAISKTNMLFLNKQGKFVLSNQQSVRIPARSTGVIFADLDNDGDLDLYVGSMSKAEKGIVGNSMFENDGKGGFRDISENNEACPLAFGGRSVTVLDYDGDGLLDLLSGEDVFPGYNGSKTKRSRLFRNKGGLEFEDVTDAVGIPGEAPGYGVAAADVNNDGWPDFFIASADGGNKLFINKQDGTFMEAKSLNNLFEWPGSGGDRMVCGVSFGDVNRDGLLDMILGPHFIMPAINQESVRLFLNKGNDKNGVPIFVEVTEEAGLEPLAMKAPHVEFQDFDNDGWPDILTSIIKFKDGKPYPVIFRHTGLNKNSIPIYQDFEINDYPTEEDLKIERSAEFFDKMLLDDKIIYSAPGPTGDFNNDGKLDLFFPSWWVERPSYLLRNETPGGNWIQVIVAGQNGVNKMGVGAKVNIYKNGKLGEKDNLLGTQDISVGYGYASGHQAMVHFGLGKHKKVDVEVILPHGKGIITERKVKANQRITIQ